MSRKDRLRKQQKARPTEQKKRFWTARRLTLLAALGAVAGILGLGPTTYQACAARQSIQIATAEAPRPDITMSLRASTTPQRDASGVRVTFEVAAENRGRKTAEFFYWHLNVPLDNVVTAEGRRNIDNRVLEPAKEKDAHGVRYLHFQGYVDKPLPQIGMNFARLNVQIKPDSPPFKVRWQITCCDDMIFPRVPDTNDRRLPIFGSIVIDAANLKRWDVLETLPAPTAANDATKR